jgi:uncharacterized protein YutE (UPF0331/DUF86 family)
MVEDALLHKCLYIDRCIERVKAVYGRNPDALENDMDVQDIVLLNLQRICQTTIDLAMNLIKRKKLRSPKDSKDAFRILEQAKVIDPVLSRKLRALVWFRHVAGYQYEPLNHAFIRATIEANLGEFQAFAKTFLQWTERPSCMPKPL